MPSALARPLISAPPQAGGKQQRQAALATAGLDEGLLSLYLAILFDMENPYR